MATVAMLGLPVVGFANTLQDPAPQQQPTQPQPADPQPQQPQPAQPKPTEPQPQPAQPQPADPQPTQPQSQPQQPAAPTPAPQSQQAVSPQEHLSQAKAAVDGIAATAVPAKNRAQLAQLKKHLAALDKAGSASAETTTAPKASAKSTANWGTEVAAIDKIITEMVGSETTGASTPGTTGTSGSSKAENAVALDEATRSKLMEVRAHITAYAAGMSGTSTPKTDETAAATSAAPSEPSSPAATPSTASSSAPQSAAPGSEPAAPAAAQSQPPAAQAQDAAAQPQAAQPQIDADAARRHLMAARESLSQLTQLPAATQLSGEARTQVAQLISNFNELITTQSNWRASYAKVNANVTALIGAENGDAEATGGAPAAAPGAAATPGATSTPGAVGTAGATTVELDPAIRAKLVEFRHNLVEFQKASGGAEK
jgi:DNA polymerase-3 subunit gamma/tau